jgi:hypothetical protein
MMPAACSRQGILSMLDFDNVHKRYWLDQRHNPTPAIPRAGGEFMMHAGRRYAVLFDVDHEPVAIYEVVERLFAVKDGSTMLEHARELRAPDRRARLPRERVY